MISTEHLEATGIPSANISSSVYGILSVLSLSLVLVIHRIKHRCQQGSIVANHPDPWIQSSKMEKADTDACQSSTRPPPASATEALEPLSRGGSVPNSGAVAAKAREQMHSAKSLETSKSDPKARLEDGTEGNGSVQKRSESVQQMREVDGDGVRVWKRLIVEYH